MGTILTFTPRQRPAEPAEPEPLAGPALREQIEGSAQAALDLADHLIGLLNRVDGDTDLEDGADAEPSLAAPENQGSQVTWTRGGDADCEAEAAEIVLPEVAIEPWPLPWSGRSNVLAAAGVALLEMVGG